MMGDRRRVCTVGQAASVSEAYVAFMVRTWWFGGAAEGGKGKGKVEGS